MEQHSPQAGIQSLGKGATEQREGDSGISRNSEKQERGVEPSGKCRPGKPLGFEKNFCG